MISSTDSRWYQDSGYCDHMDRATGRHFTLWYPCCNAVSNTTLQIKLRAEQNTQFHINKMTQETQGQTHGASSSSSSQSFSDFQLVVLVHSHLVLNVSLTSPDLMKAPLRFPLHKLINTSPQQSWITHQSTNIQDRNAAQCLLPVL